MPCRDWEMEKYEAVNYRKRCDELAARLCSSRQVLYALYDYFAAHGATNDLPPNLEEDVASEIEGLKEHRERDKSHAILEIGHKISGLQRDIKKIKELKGKPSDALLQELKDLKAKKLQMKNSNSMNTGLY